jgi:hypothetical protein
LHLIREAAEFADVLERDAQRASAAQLSRTKQEVRRKQPEVQKRESEVETFRQRSEIVNAARNEARQLLAESPGDAGAPRGRGAWRAAARVGASPGDRTDELGPRRGRADARVGPRAGDRDHGLSSAGCRAVPLGRRSRRRRDLGRVRGRSSGPRPATSKVLVHTSCRPGRSLSPPPPSPAARRPSLRLRTRATRTTPTRDSVSS